MWIARENTLFNKFSSYYMSLNKMELIQYEAYTKPEHTFYDDWKVRDDMLIVRPEEFEQAFGIKLNSLQQIEI